MKTPLFAGGREFYKSLFAIAVPIMFQNFISSFVNMLDTVMIGRLGAVEIAAVGLGNQVFFLYNLILFGICSGGGIFTAQFWGKRDILGIRKNLGFCLTLNVGTAVIFTAAAALFPDRLIAVYSSDPLVIKAGAEYLRALSPGFFPFALSLVVVLALRSVEKVKLAITSTLIALSINAVLNYVFIFGAGPVPAMGVSGAAIATVISRFAEMFIVIAGCYIMRYPPAGTMKELFSFNAAYAGRFLKITSPVILNEALWSLGITIQNLIFARASTEAIAAFNITNTVSQLTWVVFIGLGNGVAVLVGKKIGEGKEETAREYASRIVRFAPLLSLGAIPILIPLSKLLPFIFNTGPEVLDAAAMMFTVMCFMYPLRAFNMSMIIGVCRAGGDTIFCAVYDLAFMWGLALPAAAIACFIFHAPAVVIFASLNIEEPVKLMLGLWRFRSGKWLHNVVG